MSTRSVGPGRRPAVFRRVWSALVVGAMTAAACAPRLQVEPGPTTGEPTPQLGPLNAEEQAVHLLSRATYGARPEDIEEVLRIGRAAWLDRQLNPGGIAEEELPERLSLWTGGAGTADRTVASATVMSPPTSPPPAPPSPGAGDGRTPPAPAPPASPRAVGAPSSPGAIPLSPTSTSTAPLVQAPTGELRSSLPSIDQLTTLKLIRAVHAERQLEQVMTDFWFNHFNVYFNKIPVMFAVSDYETVIQRHVFGRFEDLLIATATHPAMLAYLDNASNVAPSGQSQGGVNENYARELLELHTLGVGGGYTQEDVVQVARAFTGWTTLPRPTPSGVVRLSTAPIVAEFVPDLHDDDPKVVLGTPLTSSGVGEGFEVLRLLATHPATATHVATKLVRHFVADEPPPALVAEVAAVFRSTQGDLREVTRALFSADGFYERSFYRAKVKRPFEFVASALRLSGAELRRPQGRVPPGRIVAQQLRAFGHQPYMEPAPTGYPVTHEDWVSAGAMLGRMNFALEVAAGWIPDVVLDLARTFDGAVEPVPELVSFFGHPPSASASPGPGAGPDPNAEERRRITTLVLQRIFPAAPVSELQLIILEDLDRPDAGGEGVMARRALGLALGSPHFQRH